jgi:hypothetical protein
LKKTKQRVPAPRGGQPSLRLPAAPIAGGTLSPSTSEKPDNGARRCGDPGNIGRNGKPRLAEGMFLYVVSVALVAAATIVLFSLASVSLLDTRKETLTGSRIDNSPIEDKFISTVVSYTDSNAAPVAVQTKSRSSSEANNLPSSTLVPLPSGVPREEAVAEPALNLPPDGEATSAAVESLHGSTRGPSTDEPPPEASGSQEVKESAGFYGSAASPRSHPPLRHAASRRPGVVQADRDNIAKKLNRAELSRLLEGKRALSRAPLR